MSAVAQTLNTYRTNVRMNRLGLWLFFFSELFLFGSLLVARFALWREDGVVSRPELDQTIGLIVTSVLLVSSYFMNRAEVSIANGKRNDFMISLMITAILGSVFLFGVMIFEWGLIPVPFVDAAHLLKPTSRVYGAVFFAMTGMHALHVVSGIVFIILVFINGSKGGYSAEKHWGVEACAIYWHYVDFIWIFFYPALYLIGKVTHNV